MNGSEFQLIIFSALVASFIIGWSFGYFIDRRYLKNKKLRKDILKEYDIIKSEKEALKNELSDIKESFRKKEIQLNEEIKVVKDGLKILRKKKLDFS